jgi:hypothetical protein
VLRLDLTGQGPLLGDLDTAITTFTKPSDTPPGPLPRFDFKNIAIIGKTLSGDVNATAAVTSSDESIVVSANAPASSLGMNGATVSLAGADLRAVIVGERLSASLKLDLSRFEAADASLADVKIDATIDQDAGVLKGVGSASLGALEAGGRTASQCDGKWSDRRRRDRQRDVQPRPVAGAGAYVRSQCQHWRRISPRLCLEVCNPLRESSAIADGRLRRGAHLRRR